MPGGYLIVTALRLLTQWVDADHIRAITHQLTTTWWCNIYLYVLGRSFGVFWMIDLFFLNSVLEDYNG